MVDNSSLREINASEQELFREVVSDRLPDLKEENIGTPVDALVGVVSPEDNLDYIDHLASPVFSAEVSYKIGEKVVTLSRIITEHDAYTSVDTIEPLPGQQPKIEKYEVFDEAKPIHVIFGGIPHPGVAASTQELRERSQVLAERANEERTLGLDMFTTADLDNVLDIISKCNDSNRLPD